MPSMEPVESDRGRLLVKLTTVDSSGVDANYAFSLRHHHLRMRVVDFDVCAANAFRSLKKYKEKNC